MGCHVHIQGIFPEQESNLRLLHWQSDSLPLATREAQFFYYCHFKLLTSNHKSFAYSNFSLFAIAVYSLVFLSHMSISAHGTNSPAFCLSFSLKRQSHGPADHTLSGQPINWYPWIRCPSLVQLPPSRDLKADTWLFDCRTLTLSRTKKKDAFPDRQRGYGHLSGKWFSEGILEEKIYELPSSTGSLRSFSPVKMAEVPLIHSNSCSSTHVPCSLSPTP